MLHEFWYSFAHRRCTAADGHLGIWAASGEHRPGAACEKLWEQFSRRDQTLAPKAVEHLGRDWDRLVTFYQFPREHWRHLRTTNVAKSPFAALRRRTAAAKRYKRVESATALIWKLLQVAEQAFRRLTAPELLPAVYAGAPFVDGIPQRSVAQKEIAA